MIKHKERTVEVNGKQKPRSLFLEGNRDEGSGKKL